MGEGIVYENVDAIASATGAASTQIAEASVRHSWTSGRSLAGPPGLLPGLTCQPVDQHEALCTGGPLVQGADPTKPALPIS